MPGEEVHIVGILHPRQGKMDRVRIPRVDLPKPTQFLQIVTTNILSLKVN